MFKLLAKKLINYLESQGELEEFLKFKKHDRNEEKGYRRRTYQNR